MAYSIFSTEHADYIFQLGNHLFRNKQNVFEGVDAIVIETGFPGLENIIAYGHPQMDLPLRYCKENGIPVFGTDTPPTKWGKTRDLFGEFIPYLLLSIPIFAATKSLATFVFGPAFFQLFFDAPLFYYGFTSGGVNEAVKDAYSLWKTLLQTPIISGRDAINARKIEEFIAPNIGMEIGRKPKIGLVFGAGHMGMEYHLRYPLLRNTTLWNWKNLNFGRYAGFNEKCLPLVEEARWSGRWMLTQYMLQDF